jgi:hypothetical protein
MLQIWQNHIKLGNKNFEARKMVGQGKTKNSKLESTSYKNLANHIKPL